MWSKPLTVRFTARAAPVATSEMLERTEGARIAPTNMFWRSSAGGTEYDAGNSKSSVAVMLSVAFALLLDEFENFSKTFEMFSFGVLGGGNAYVKIVCAICKMNGDM
jgi:hypothetical protein